MVALVGLKQFASIVAPAFLALNLMIVVWPLMSVLKRFLPRLVAGIVTGLAAVTILALFFWALGWAGSLFVKEVPQYKGQGVAVWQQLLALASQYGVTSTEITAQLEGIDPSSVVSVVGRVVSNVSGVVSLLVVVISVLLFMIIDSIGFDERLERLGERHSRVLALALQSFAQGVRRYWVTSTVFGLIVALVTWAGLIWIGVPLAAVWAMLSFVTNYIPNIGFIIGLLPAAVMGFLAKGLLGLVLVVVLYSVSNFVIQSMIQPKFTGEAVGVTSTVSFLSLLVWTYTLGALGALLALPATLFVKAVVVDADPQMRWLNALIASNPRTSDEEPVLPVDDVASDDQPGPTEPRPGHGDEVSGSSAWSRSDLVSGTARPEPVAGTGVGESRTGGSDSSGPTPTSAGSAPEVAGSAGAYDCLPDTASSPGAAPDPSGSLPAHSADGDLPGPVPAHALAEQAGVEKDALATSPSTPPAVEGSGGSRGTSRADGPGSEPAPHSSGQVRPGGPDHTPEPLHGSDRVLGEQAPETVGHARTEPALRDQPAPQSEDDEPLDEPRPQRPWDGESTLELPAVSAPRRAKEQVSPDGTELDPYTSRARSAGPRMQSSATPHWSD